jgi:hypothetical protein
VQEAFLAVCGTLRATTRTEARRKSWLADGPPSRGRQRAPGESQGVAPRAAVQRRRVEDHAEAVVDEVGRPRNGTRSATRSRRCPAFSADWRVVFRRQSWSTIPDGRCRRR